jgi:hypothetical protein
MLNCVEYCAAHEILPRQTAQNGLINQYHHWVLRGFSARGGIYRVNQSCASVRSETVRSYLRSGKNALQYGEQRHWVAAERAVNSFLSRFSDVLEPDAERAVSRDFKVDGNADREQEEQQRSASCSLTHRFSARNTIA